MSYIIEYAPKVVDEDIPSLGNTVARRVVSSIDKKLLTEPTVFGKPLHQSLKNHRSLRVGDYRVVYRIIGKKVRILVIDHRGNVYKKAKKRLTG